jgi:hypothetical protein
MPTPVQADASNDIDVSNLSFQELADDSGTRFSVRLDSTRFPDFWMEITGECSAQEGLVKIIRAAGRVYHFEKRVLRINPAASRGQDIWYPKCNVGAALDGIVGEKCQWLVSASNPSQETQLMIPLRHSSAPDFQVDLYLSIPKI